MIRCPTDLNKYFDMCEITILDKKMQSNLTKTNVLVNQELSSTP